MALGSEQVAVYKGIESGQSRAKGMGGTHKLQKSLFVTIDIGICNNTNTYKLFNVVENS